MRGFLRGVNAFLRSVFPFLRGLFPFLRGLFPFLRAVFPLLRRVLFKERSVFLYQRNAAQAMFRPPPEAHMTSTSPSFNFPSRTASSKTIGMHAEPV